MLNPRRGAQDPVVSKEAEVGTGHLPESLLPFCGSLTRTLLFTLGLATLALIVSASAASAYWTTHGSGSASVTTGSLSTVSVIAFAGGDSPATSLLPGGTADVIVRVNNTNSYALVLTAISLNGSIVASGGSGTCSTTGVSTTFPSNPSITVAAGSHLVHFSNSAVMSLASSNGCQGATFQIPVSITFAK
jgi:hypothetical protein